MIWSANYIKYNKINGKWVEERGEDGCKREHQLECYKADHINDYCKNVKYVMDSYQKTADIPEELEKVGKQHMQELIDQEFGSTDKEEKEKRKMEEFNGLVKKLQTKLADAEKTVKPKAGKILLVASAIFAIYKLFLQQR